MRMCNRYSSIENCSLIIIVRSFFNHLYNNQLDKEIGEINGISKSSNSLNPYSGNQNNCYFKPLFEKPENLLLQLRKDSSGSEIPLWEFDEMDGESRSYQETG
ncbi:hypothetical protein TNCT_386311 [Trichonephila clavata]|uniref:Uncharacterized protein n=1 Tax=Trichonephila clavata TaxID=2740835 RepID=A0A8X6M0I3_TRICU|nr:hypothetical protein TNCT_386311 [Trichonephila clavata]